MNSYQKLKKKSPAKNDNQRRKIIVVLGPTASGKSALAVSLAKFIDANRKAFGTAGAEIISADSRQVYKGMDLGTGKITAREMGGVPHYMLDIVSPRKIFTASDYQKLAGKIIKNIFDAGKTPLICGGTGFYINALIFGAVFPDVKPNYKLRRALSKKNANELFKMLLKIDMKRAGQIDPQNPVRLIRALEIAKSCGRVPELKRQSINADVLFLGIKTDKPQLALKIRARLKRRLRRGMIKEVKGLHGNGLSWKRMEELGLEYRLVSRYLRGIVSKKEMEESLAKEIECYAKRQMTWFKKNKRIIWIENEKEAKTITEKFIQN